MNLSEVERIIINGKSDWSLKHWMATRVDKFNRFAENKRRDTQDDIAAMATIFELKYPEGLHLHFEPDRFRKDAMLAQLKAHKNRFVAFRNLIRVGKGPQLGANPAVARARLRIAQWCYEYMLGRLSMQEVVDMARRVEWPYYARKQWYKILVREFWSANDL